MLEVVGEAHAARDLPELRSTLIAALRRAVPADIVSYNEVSADGTPVVIIADPELPAFAHDAWERLAGTNPLVAHFVATRDGRPRRFSDLVDRQTLHASALYRELFRPLGIEHQIALLLPSSPELTVGVALSRGEPDFSDAERDMLELMRPHLIEAYRRLARPPAPPAGLERLGLTPAEARVLEAFAAGHSTDEAAAALGVTARTVAKHAERIHRKLGARDRAHAVAIAWRTR